MGASSSTEQVSAEQREIESLATSTGALLILRKAFSRIADTQTNLVPLNSLRQLFCLNIKDAICEEHSGPGCFPELLDHLGPSIIEVFFVAESGGISWTEFVKGYLKCCGRMSASSSLNALLRLFASTVAKAGLPLKVQFESEDADSKIIGSFLSTDVRMLLWMCWIMQWNSKTLKVSKGKENLGLPDINHLVLSAVVSCIEGGIDFDVWDWDISGLKSQLPAGKFQMWVLTTVPSLADCLNQFVHARLQGCTASEDKLEPSTSSAGDALSTENHDTYLLTHGRAWAISLAMRSKIGEELLRACFPCSDDGIDETLLYRSSHHGKGLNRFWSNVEGYHGPLLILISASSPDAAHESDSNVKRWIIGALTQQGFENKDIFYGSSGNLFSISPVFHIFSPSGKEKNFVYSHIHPTGRVYDPHPKPVGIGFGGSLGNERIYLDEDFARVTIRHHAVDKTYQPGFIIPNQGFLANEGLVSEVEVWGLGGERAQEMQNLHKKRENLFTEQRRKIDMKTFASWDDSPEKMMMDMIGDPNRVQREER